MQVGELFVFLGFDVDDKKLQEFDRGVLGLVNKFDLLKIAALGAAYAVEKIAQQSLNQGVGLYNLSQQTGENIEALQEWAVAAHAANPALSIDQVAQSIQNLDNQLVAIRRGTGGSGLPFMQFGINPTEMKSALDVLTALRSKMEIFDKPTTSYLLGQLGLPPGLVNVLKLPKNQWDEFIKNAVVSPENIGKLNEAKQSIADLENKLNAFSVNLTAEFAPQIEKAMKGITEAFNENLPGIESGIQNTIDGFKDLINLAKEFPTAAGVFAAGFGVIALAIAPLTTTIASLVYLIQKFEAYKKGDDNFFASLYGKSKDLDDPSKHGGLYNFLYKLGQGEADIASGQLKKNYIPPGKESFRSSSVNIYNDNDINVTGSNSDIIGKEVMQQLNRLHNKNSENITQDVINHSYQDQQNLGLNN